MCFWRIATGSGKYWLYVTQTVLNIRHWQWTCTTYCIICCLVSAILVLFAWFERWCCIYICYLYVICCISILVLSQQVNIPLLECTSRVVDFTDRHLSLWSWTWFTVRRLMSSMLFQISHRWERGVGSLQRVRRLCLYKAALEYMPYRGNFP